MNLASILHLFVPLRLLNIQKRCRVTITQKAKKTPDSIIHVIGRIEEMTVI